MSNPWQVNKGHILARLGRICARWTCALFLGCPALLMGASLSGSFTQIPSATNINLTAEGQLDWGDWGLANEWNYNHKYGVAQQITYSFITDIKDYYPYPDGPWLLNGACDAFSWSDGVPSLAVTNASNATYIFGDKLPSNVPTGFQIQCAADTTLKQLKLYLGTSGSMATLTASLGSLSYTDNTFNAAVGSPTNGVYTIIFQADSPGQTLTVNFSGIDSSGYMFLQAATLAGTDVPPTVAVSAPTDRSVFAAPATFTLTANASDADGTVTNLVLLCGTNPIAQSASGSLGLTLSNQPGGKYQFTAAATDNAGLCVTSFPTTVFITTGGGMLAGSVTTPAPNVDLTAEGTMDWAHWGLVSSTSVDQKTTGTIISSIIPLNASISDFNQYTDNPTAFTWSDGSPTFSAFGSTTGIFLYSTNTPPAAFQLVVPATPVPRRLKLYLGIFAVQARLDAWLSDWSAVPYCDSSLSSAYDSANAVYTLTFASPNAGANLNVTWRPVIVNDPAYGDETWQAATLSPPPPEPVLRVIAAPTSTNGLSFCFHGQTNVYYTVQSAPCLPTTNWQVLTNLSGAEADVIIAAPGSAATQGYYRVQAQ